MKKHIETILSSVLLGTSVLLGLSFWLNIKFGFNLFYAAHWDELAKLQASHIKIDTGFYISIGIAIFIFIFGLYLIFRPRLRKIFTNKSNENINVSQPIYIRQKTDTKTETLSPIYLTKPPKLNLPKNAATFMAQHHSTQQPVAQEAHKEPNRITLYDEQLSKIFSDAMYLVKPNIKIAGFTSNLLAIGKDEILWIGGVDCDINIFKKAIDKLKSVFTDTLEDIPINVFPFILDTKKIYDSDENIMVFHNIEDVQNTISQNPNPKDSDTDQENFDAYSDYIDTIIQYVKNI